MSDNVLSRRDFLQRAAVLGALGVSAGQILMACQPSKDGANKTPAAGGDKPAGGKLSCTDTTGLNETQIATRTANGYVDQTPKPAQKCDNCSLYKAAPAPGTCGGCAVVAGPIHPDGWCKIWVPKPA